MRVLHVHSGNLYGGVESALATLARTRRLAPSMEMAVALCFAGRIADELKAAGIEPFTIGDVRIRRPDTVLRARRALRQLLDRGGFDVVVCQQSWPLAIFGSVVREKGIPLVLWMHMAHQNHWIDRLAWRVPPDLVICNSHFTASTLPPGSAPVEVVYPAVEGQAMASPPPRRRARRAQQVILQASRMEPLKGQAVCLGALGRLRDRADWICWQAGGAQRPEERRYAAELREQAQQIGIGDRVEFLGQRSDVRRLCAEADIFCQPNLEPDAFGIGFIEALSAGCPVVTSSIGGALEIVDDTCGVLVPPGDVEALASAMSALLDNADERERLAAGGGRRAADLCDPAKQVPRVAEVLSMAGRALVRH
jgi:glycosyltransferase involved in cell wall biosynthesis